MAPLAQLFGGGGRGGCSVRRRSNSFESAGGTTEPPASAPTDRTPAPPARLRVALRSARKRVERGRALPARGHRGRFGTLLGFRSGRPRVVEPRFNSRRGGGTGSSSAGAEAAASVVCGRRFKAIAATDEDPRPPSAPKVIRASGATSPLAFDHLPRRGSRASGFRQLEVIPSTL